MSNLETLGCGDLLTAAQMRALERAAMDSGMVTGLQLMERAGRATVAAILQEWPELAEGARRAVVLCGPGNNGGDGFVIARLLRNRGWAVDVFLYGDPERMSADARANHDHWAAMGEVRRLGFPEVTRAQALEVARTVGTPEMDEHCDVLVDAIFGTGLARAPDGLGALFEADEIEGFDFDVRRVAVDMPTGLCSDSGRVFPDNDDFICAGAFLRADLTVTFGAAKPGHVLERGPGVCGALVVADIGLPDLHDLDAEHPLWADGEPACLASAPHPFIAKRSGHKYAHGHALVLAGGLGRTGAARLAARAALRVGAGLVTVAAPGEAMMECAAQLTAIMLRRCDDAGALSEMLEDARLNAVCLGPGLGGGQRTRDLVAAVLGAIDTQGAWHPGRGAVLDADALTAFADDPEALFALLRRFGPENDRVVLTPHMGEFARLFPDIAARLTAPPDRGPMFSRIDAARAAAARASAVVLLKGPDTVVSSPRGWACVNAGVYERAAPWLATAGTGDVLSGLIAGLLARGLGARRSAEFAAWLHVEAARAFGPGLIAEDLPEILPEVLARLERGAR
jgi:hydroxyethylthiazole kinase-like uncharacterized protein yjeF